MKFSQYIKLHYGKVKGLSHGDRLKVLAKHYKDTKTKGGDFGSWFTDKLDNVIGDIGSKAIEAAKTLTGGSVQKKPKRERKRERKHTGDVEGKGLLSDAFGMVGLPSPLAMLGLGLNIPSSHTANPQPMNLVPPSVPIDRAYNRSSSVPGPLKFTEASFNPHEEEIKIRQQSDGPMLGQPGMSMPAFPTDGMSEVPHGGGILSGLLSTFGLGLDMPKEKVSRTKKAKMPRNVSDKTETSTGGSLKEILKKHKIPMPKGMRNKMPGSRLTKAHLLKIYDSAVAKHGEEKGGSFLSDAWDGISTGFKMPFKALGAIL